MDPNAALKAIRKLYDREQSRGLSEDETAELCGLLEGLDDWLTSGGFLPRDWAR